MESQKSSPNDRAPLLPPKASLDKNRRTRLAPRKGKGVEPLPPKIHSWLIRTTRIHAHLCYVVRCFGRPQADTRGDTVEARAERRDRTLLYDCWAHAIGELWQLQAELSEEMEPGESTEHAPGSPQKLEILAARASRLESLFAEHDAQIDPAPRVDPVT